MRRMITESDVEKLDSIQPSEIEKLGAMQDPKEATAGKVLTADGTGKAVYKAAPSAGTKIFHTTESITNEIKHSDIKGNYVEVYVRYGQYALSPSFYNNPIKSGDTTIPWSEVTLLTERVYPDVYVYIMIPEATMTKYNLTVGSPISANVSYFYYNE